MFGKAHIPAADQSDEHLMQMVARGEQSAFELLYDRYFNKLVWFARGYVDDQQLAEDAVQEVFMRIIECPEKFDLNRRFSTWAYTITANQCKNVLRNHANRSRLFNEHVAYHFSEAVPASEQSDLSRIRERIRSVYATLTPKEKNIFVLRFEEELSIKEIASIIDIPEGSVKSGIFYLLKKFSQNLKEFRYGK